MTHQNSIAAHRSNRYGERCRAVMAAIKKGPGTDRDIMRRLGKVDPNSVRPRVTELVKAGALEEVGTQIDAETGKTVRVVDIPRSELFKACAAMAIVQAKQLTLGFSTMAYEHRELSGSAWPERKFSDKAPDYKGEVLIGGKLYGLAMWKRTTKSNREYLSVQLSTPEAHAERKRKEAEARANRAGIPTAAPTPPQSVPMPDPERNRTEPELPGVASETTNIPF